MPSPRSLFAAKQHQTNHSPTESIRTNGWPWARRSMNESSSEVPPFSFRSMFSPLSSPANMPDSDEQTKEPPQPASQPQKGLAPAPDYAEKGFRRFHLHTLSDTTTASSESSPTTTISTVDDSSATEASPGSSPESPPPGTFAPGMPRPRTSDDARPFFELQKQLPPRKGRNLKGLAVNTSRTPNRPSSSLTSLPLPAIDNVSSATSSSFVKPPTPPKRKPSNLGLTLLTPVSSKAPPPQEIKLTIPPTPGVGRPATLRHFQSSPSLPVVPGLGPQRIAVPQIPSNRLALDTIFPPISPAQGQVEEEEQNFDVPLSKEEKPEAYPEGPICVYEPYIDLYLEPTAEQCRQYDVVMNVASEVRNPLIDTDEAVAEEPEIRIDGGGGIQYAPKRDRPSPWIREDTADQQDNSPTTPKATPSNSPPSSDDSTLRQKEPEYVHVKWEHNSDIVPDLLRLVKFIDEKVMDGKRMLIHCQCGVSRSASLVVAYGMYKDPSLSVQEAYDAVKRRSKWIGPNMNLIMQLQEFRTSLARGGVLAADRGLSPLTPASALSEWGGPFSRQSPHPDAPISASAGNPSPSQTADSLPLLSSGPSSAPNWPLRDDPLPPPPGQRARAISAVKPGSNYVNASGRVVPVVPILNVVGPESTESSKSKDLSTTVEQIAQDSDSATPTERTTLSRTEEEFAMTPLQPSPDFDSADSFGVMSPTSTEFATNPFDRSALLAQLGMGPVRQQDDVPRRSVSLSKSKPQTTQDDTATALGPKRLRTLRGKISSPSIREQQQLQSLQAKIEASLPHRSAAQAPAMDEIDEALMSPRATEFTQNPFALALSMPRPSSLSPDEPRTSDSDPRSPAHKGVSPITRNILDVL